MAQISHDAAFQETRTPALGDNRPVDYGCIALNPKVTSSDRRLFLRYFQRIKDGCFGDFNVVT